MTPIWKPERKFWSVYMLAWLPYLTGLTLVFLSERPAALTDAIIGASTTVLPLVVGGVALIAVLARVPWDTRNKRLFFLKQMGFALCFVFSTLVLIQLMYGFRFWLTGGRFSFSLLQPMVPFIVFNNFMIFCTISALSYGLQSFARLRQEEKRASQAEMLRSKAELQAMRAQLNPHFLFNTLHSLQALVRNNPERAELALEQFGDLMRYPLGIQRKMLDRVRLEEEWAFVETYLDLEKLRLAERLKIERHIQMETFACLVPVFCLQPLVENAIKFSVEPRADGGRISISTRIEGKQMRLTVSDEGSSNKDRPSREGTGQGLNLLRRRIDVLYGDRASVSIDHSEDTVYTVHLSIPVEKTGTVHPC